MQVGSKKPLLVIHKIQRLFVNTLTPDDKHYLLNGDILAQRIQMHLSQKQKTFSAFFSAFLKSILNYKDLRKKRCPSYLMYFGYYRLRKTWLDNCLKSRISEDPQTDNMENGSKQFWNLKDSTFTIFINHCECSCIGKSLFQ